ncbi:non-homologous end-joining DNA ligase [Spiractinospora alimapuensis]|uniref:non-homologous end-joining DNA ligase n=1 Tax=Spiractinospora alimapuensis TaxID=2820884 RepID=UPI001F183DC9|nr:non-homologous end-joining DNA ligase [Spiractinospora alimapuensis]QVQ50461.1 non-homologous end-joining DNA ligase [Spiractinospora alimapuensis]
MGTVQEEYVHSGRHAVRIGKPDKEMFGEGGVTKRELAEHYAAVAPWMVPLVSGHPLALQRFPHGITGEGFFQKQVPAGAPAWVDRVTVPRDEGGTVTMVVCESAATLLWLADQAAITLHSWLSRGENPRYPDRIIVDLDPADGDFAAVRQAAREVREVLVEAGLATYLMTTGSRGLHVVSPLRPEQEYADVRELARTVADRTADRHPNELTTLVRKNRRRGRLFLDVLRNSYAQHAVAPYSVRPLPGAPVATPLFWEELDDLPSAQQWTVRTLESRLDQFERAGDAPWAGMMRHARSPRKAARLAAAIPEQRGPSADP